MCAWRVQVCFPTYSDMNGCTLPSSGIVLHVWPGQWALPSFDPQCLAALLYLQLAIPGQFHAVECSYPDLSPTGKSFASSFSTWSLKIYHERLGQLPFLTHEQHVVAPCTSIIKYIAGLSNSEPAVYSNANLDAHLTPSEKSKRTAWFSHAGSHLSDLVVRPHFSWHFFLFWKPLASTILSMQSMKTGWIWRIPCWLLCSPCHRNTLYLAEYEILTSRDSKPLDFGIFL